ncbi:hypothetical protein B0H17DRAFT_1206041 [Mycena rosella]|uniref:Uncharacterized protein n=1 Tax=Mycena rosella TaxID=1033263 RepID=A0AAD7D5T8_MYCRO|nr:hypothetical protein B0H17DRAFT_1206041 [Mycena rosella]
MAKETKEGIIPEAANLNTAGAVMHEALVDRHSLNTYESPALDLAVGLHALDAAKLRTLEQHAKDGTFKINAAPKQFKRKAEALIEDVSFFIVLPQTTVLFLCFIRVRRPFLDDKLPPELD